METLHYMMLYHTTIRNIGLFSSVTLALMSRKDKYFDIVSLFTSSITLFLNYYTLLDFEKMNLKDEKINKWNNLLKIMGAINIVLFLFAIYRIAKNNY